MPATPDENDVPDLFTDSAGQSDEEMLASSRMQVGLVVGTGVLVIVITTLVVVLMGHNGQSIADGPNRPVGITSQLPPLPTPAPVVASAQPTESPDPTRVTQTPSQTKKPTTPPRTTAGPTIATLASLSCTPSTVTGGQDSTCTISLSVPAHANLTIALSSSNSGLVSVPGSVSIAAGGTSQSFTAGTDPISAGSSEITASLDGASDTFTITVTLLA
ncbi:MAG TPA: hypothetical protein DGT23_00560 [Micromonosporaceae bacterium]|nr:hypothetical protein [Micromonosporaceae bacterium]